MSGSRTWRPNWTWRLRQLGGMGFIGSFVVMLAVMALVKAIAPFWMMAVFWGWVGLLLLFVLGMLVLRWWTRHLWRRVAGDHGWEVRWKADELFERWPFPPFDDKPGYRVLDVTFGEHRGRRFWAGYFQYQKGKARVGFCFIDLEVDRPLPSMEVMPEPLVGELAPGLLPMDLHLESAEFNDRFRLLRGDPVAAHALLTPRVMEVMLSVPPFGWVSHGDRFVLLTPDFQQPQTVLAHLNAGCDLLELIPGHVWRPG